MWVCPGERGRNRVNQSSESSVLFCCWAVWEAGRVAVIYQLLRATLGPCQLLAEPQHCSVPPTQSRKDLPFLPLEGVLPTADEAGPHEHTENVSSAGEEMLSDVKSHFPAPCTGITEVWTTLWTYMGCFFSHHHVQLPLSSQK